LHPCLQGFIQRIEGEKTSRRRAFRCTRPPGHIRRSKPAAR